jgi:O-antigen ligase
MEIKLGSSARGRLALMLSHQKKEAGLVFLFSALFFLFPIVLTLSNLPLLLLIVIFIITCRRKGYGSMVASIPVLWTLLALYGLVLLGATYTTSTPDWVLLHLSKYAKFIYASIIILLLNGQPNIQKAALNSFVAALFFILMSTWLNVWFLLPWSVTQETGWGKTHHVFGDYITQSVMMAFFTVIAVHRWVEAAQWMQRLFWACTAMLAAFSISHLSEARTGLVVLTVGLIGYALAAARGKRLFGSLLGVGVFIIVAFGSSTMLQSQFAQAIQEAERHAVDPISSIGHRLHNYQMTPRLIAEKPLFGHGTGAYHTEICRWVEKPEWCSIFRWHPHNQFLFFGADHGLLGISLYGLLILMLYRTALRSPSREAKVLLFSLTSILLFDSLVNSPFYSSRESQFFAYMLALLVSMGQPRQVQALQ